VIGIIDSNGAARIGGGYNVDANGSAAPGDYSRAIEGDRAVVIPVSESGDHVVVCWLEDPPDDLAPGERRLVGRSPTGQIMASLTLAGDGSIRIDGDFAISGSLMLGLLDLGKHVHETPQGPSGPPKNLVPPVLP